MRKRIILATVATMTLLVAGCGSSGDVKDTVQSTTTSVVSTTLIDKSTADEEVGTEDVTSKENYSTENNDEETADVTTLSGENETTKTSDDETTISREETTTKKDDSSELETTTKKNDSSERETTAKKNDTSERETTTKKNDTSERETTTKKNDISEKETTTSRQEPTTTSKIEEETTTSKAEEETTVKELYSDKAKQLAKSVTDKIIKNDMSDLGKAIAVQEWIFNNVSYSEFEGSKYPEDVLQNKVANIRGFAHLYKILAETAGLTATAIEGNKLNHHTWKYSDYGWNQIKLGGKWYNIDTYRNAYLYNNYPYSAHNPDLEFYDLFLVSDDIFNEEFTDDLGEKYLLYTTVESKATCATSYERATILEYMEDTNMYNVIFAADVEEFLQVITEKFEAGASTMNVFYQDEAFIGLNNATWIGEMDDERKSLPFRVDCDSGWLPNAFGVAVYEIIFPYTYSEWNNIPIVTNQEEWDETLEGGMKEGEVTILMRVEPVSHIYHMYYGSKFTIVNGTWVETSRDYKGGDYYLIELKVTVVEN